MAATVPKQTTPFKIKSVTMSTIVGRAEQKGDGGLPILEWQLGYGNHPSVPRHFTWLNSEDRTITGVVPRQTWYFWNRVRNAKGWSPWSGRTQVFIPDLPDAPTRPYFSEIGLTTARITWSPNFNGGVPITGFRYFLGTANPPTSFVDVGPNVLGADLTKLTPGTRYYVQAQAKNKFGFSEKTGVNSVILGYGAKTRSSGLYKKSLPYVKYQGTWRPTESWVKIAGMWKRTE